MVIYFLFLLLEVLTTSVDEKEGVVYIDYEECITEEGREPSFYTLFTVFINSSAEEVKKFEYNCVKFYKSGSYAKIFFTSKFLDWRILMNSKSGKDFCTSSRLLGKYEYPDSVCFLKQENDVLQKLLKVNVIVENEIKAIKKADGSICIKSEDVEGAFLCLFYTDIKIKNKLHVPCSKETVGNFIFIKIVEDRRLRGRNIHCLASFEKKPPRKISVDVEIVEIPEREEITLQNVQNCDFFNLRIANPETDNKKIESDSLLVMKNRKEINLKYNVILASVAVILITFLIYLRFFRKKTRR